MVLGKSGVEISLFCAFKSPQGKDLYPKSIFLDEKEDNPLTTFMEKREHSFP